MTSIFSAAFDPMAQQVLVGTPLNSVNPLSVIKAQLRPDSLALL
jgi:hypothetical protein